MHNSNLPPHYARMNTNPNVVKCADCTHAYVDHMQTTPVEDGIHVELAGCSGCACPMFKHPSKAA